MSMAMQGSGEKTTDLTLTTQERDELRLALRTYVTDMRMQIAHTDRSEFREKLRAGRAVLEEVLRRLVKRRPAWPSKNVREAE